MTTAEFRKATVAAFRKANPTATNVHIEWTYGPVTVKWADGTKGFSGTVRVSADGYRTRTMVATYLSGSGIMLK